jgi:hypothetical protein
MLRLKIPRRHARRLALGLWPGNSKKEDGSEESSLADIALEHMIVGSTVELQRAVYSVFGSPQ